jgi:phage shock protein E
MLKNAGELISEAQQSINCLDVAGAKSKLNECPNAIILDVREESSAQNSKLNKSINISRGLLEMMVHKHCPDAETVILTHCAGGGRASLAALTLKNMGYQNVYAITAPYEDIKKSLG